MVAFWALLVVLLASPLRDSPGVWPNPGDLLTPARRSPAMTNQRILLGDCLDVLADQRNVPAIVADPPANIAFMGRSWDRAHPVDDYVLPCVPRSKAHERELRSEESFIRYWAERYAMGYDIADQHAQGNVHPTVKSYRLMHWLHSLTGAKKIVDLCAEAVTIAQARHAFWSGLSHEARRTMVEESIVPSSSGPDERQRSLF